MNPPSKDIATMLEAAGVGSFGFTLFVSMLPQDPDLCIAVIDTGGAEPVDSLTGIIFEEPTIQVRVRAGDYSAAYSKAKEVFDALHAKHNTTESGTYYPRIRAMSGILSLGRDARNRSEFSLNFRLYRA